MPAAADAPAETPARLQLGCSRHLGQAIASLARGRPLRLLAVAGLVVLPFVVYRHLLEPGRAPGDFDAFAYVYPYGRSLAQAWSSGRWLPLWNPSIFLGAPLLANNPAAALYPPTLLFLLVPGPAAISWSMILHLAVAGLGMFFFGLRAARLRVAGSLVAAAAYVLGSHLTVHLAQLNQTGAFAWAPWLMLAFDRAAVRPGARKAGAIALLTALTILAGHSQQAYLALVAAGLAGALALLPAFRDRRWRSVGLAAATWTGGVVLGAGVAAAQLLPTLELTRYSYRSGGLSLAAADVQPLPVRGLMGSLLPHYSVPAAPEYAGASAATVILVLAGLSLLRWRRPGVAWWAGVSLLAMWAATGESGRLFVLLFHVVPGLDLFRAPGRLLLLSTIGTALLAGQGATTARQLAAVSGRPRWRLRATRALAVVGTAGLVVLLAALAGRLPAVAGQHSLRALPLGVHGRDLALMATFGAAALTACALAVRTAGRAAAAALAVALVALATGDAWLATQSYHTRTSIPAELYSEPGPAAALVAPSQDQRVMSLVTIGSLTDFARLDVARRPNVAMGDGRLTPDGYDGGLLPLRSYVGFRASLLGPGSPNAPDIPVLGQTERVWDPSWLDRAGVAAVLADAGSDPNPPTCECLQLVAVRDGVGLWTPTASHPTRAWVEGAAGRTPARVASDTGERVVVGLPAGAPGRLVLADAYYPGWSASVDGRPAAIRPYAGFLRALDVPPGARQAVFTYQPASARVGLAISGLSLLLVAALLVLWPVIKPSLPPRGGGGPKGRRGG